MVHGIDGFRQVPLSASFWDRVRPCCSPGTLSPPSTSRHPRNLTPVCISSWAQSKRVTFRSSGDGLRLPDSKAAPDTVSALPWPPWLLFPLVVTAAEDYLAGNAIQPTPSKGQPAWLKKPAIRLTMCVAAPVTARRWCSGSQKKPWQLLGSNDEERVVPLLSGIVAAVNYSLAS